MAKRITVTPAYGRDYKSKQEAVAAWEAGKDFVVADMGQYMGAYINKEDAQNDKITEVNIRFKGLTQVVVVKVASGKTAEGIGGGFEPGHLYDDVGWQPGGVVPRAEDPETYLDQGTQVPPARDSFGNELDADGKEVPSIERVASDKEWAKFATRTHVLRMGAGGPRSVRDWQLYDVAGAGQAAKELTSALSVAKKELRTLLKPIKGYDGWPGPAEKLIGKAVATVMNKHMYPVMDRNSKAGAADSEPRYVAEHALINEVKAHYGISPGMHTGIGDYV